MYDMRHMRLRRAAWLLALLAAAAPGGGAIAQRAAPDAVPPLAVAGWVETAWLPDHDLALEAKLDTGADTSSLGSGRYETFMREGRQWVRFDVEDRDGRTRRIEAPVVRTARIRRAGAGVATRPVIALRLCVAGSTGEAEFTLADRTGMAYPVLIGRRFMAGRLTVDSGRKFAGAEKCATAAPR